MFCPNCKNEIAEGSKFCYACGYKLANEENCKKSNKRKNNVSKKYIIAILIVLILTIVCSLFIIGEHIFSKDSFDKNDVELTEEKDNTAKNYKIINAQPFSDNMAWVECKYGKKSDITRWVCIDTTGKIAFVLDEGASAPQPFKAGVSYYKNTNGSFSFIDKNGIEIFDSGTSFDDVISGGDGYYAVYKYSESFDNAGYSVFIINSKGETTYTFTEIFEDVPTVIYSGDAVFAYNTWNTLMSGSSAYLFINARNGNSFKVSGIASNNSVENIFVDGVALVEIGSNRMGDKPTLIYSNYGTTKELEITNYDFYNYGKINDGGFVFTRYYDEVNAVYFYNLKNGYITKLGNYGARVDLRRTSNLFFDNGYILLPLTGADSKKYYTVLDKNGTSLFDPKECNGAYALGNNRLYISYSDRAVVTDAMGTEIFETQISLDNTFYSCGFALIDNGTNYLDINGNKLFSDGLIG